MLVLSRVDNESITIGDGIVVTLLKTKSGQAKLGIEAPADVKVLRTELVTALTASDTSQDETAKLVAKDAA